MMVQMGLLRCVLLTVQYAVNEMLANQESHSNHIEQGNMVKNVMLQKALWRV